MDIKRLGSEITFCRFKLLVSYSIFFIFYILKFDSKIFFLAFLTNNIICKIILINYLKQRKSIISVLLLDNRIIVNLIKINWCYLFFYLISAMVDLLCINLIFYCDISKFLSLYTTILFLLQISKII